MITKINMKRTFVTFAVGEVYEKLSKVLESSINSFSDYKLIIYTPEDFDIEYKSELWNGPRSINFSYKILSCLKALENHDEVVWLDNDCVATYNIDKIWNNKIESYPLLPRHRFYNFEKWPHTKVNYRDPNLLVKAKEKIGIIDNDFDNNYLQACCMFFNKNCKEFLDKVMYYYQDYDSSIFPFGDESIINLLIWKDKYKLNLGDVSICSHYFSPYKINEFINLKNADDYPKIFDLNHIGFPNNNKQDDKYATHNRLGLINNNFENILFIHGSKSDSLHNSFLTNMINKLKIKSNIETDMKKVIVFGFSHCGTTILKSIIGHIPDVHEIIDETDVITDSDIINAGDKNFILCKYPQAKDIFFTDLYDDYIKIFIIRNPLWVYSSLNKRTNYNITNYHSIDKFINVCNLYNYYKNNPKNNLYLIRYEDIFNNNYDELKSILNNIGFEYNDSIFNNELYVNKSHSHITEIPKDIVDNTDHDRYRTYQINQPFKKNNDIEKIDLIYSQIHTMINSDEIKSIYPNIFNTIKDFKLVK